MSRCLYRASFPAMLATFSTKLARVELDTPSLLHRQHAFESDE